MYEREVMIKVGQKVRVVKSFGGPEGSYTGSTPFKDEFIIITAKNIDAVESWLRGGLVEIPGSFREDKKPSGKQNASTNILPDNRSVESKSSAKTDGTDGRVILRSNIFTGQSASGDQKGTEPEHPAELREDASDGDRTGVSKGVGSRRGHPATSGRAGKADANK